MFSYFTTNYVYNIIEYFSYLNLWLIILFLFIIGFFIIVSSTQLVNCSRLSNNVIFETLLVLFSLFLIIIIISPALIILLDLELIIMPTFIIYSTGMQWMWAFSLIYLNLIKNCDHYIYSSYEVNNVFFGSECSKYNNSIFYLYYKNWFFYKDYSLEELVFEQHQCLWCLDFYCAFYIIRFFTKYNFFININNYKEGKEIIYNYIEVFYNNNCFFYHNYINLLFIDKIKILICLVLVDCFKNTKHIIIMWYNLFLFFFKTNFYIIYYALYYLALFNNNFFSYIYSFFFSRFCVIWFWIYFKLKWVQQTIIYNSECSERNKLNIAYLTKTSIADFIYFNWFYFLNINKFILLPLLGTIRYYVFSYDVIHSVGIYSFGIKIDAIPARFNFTSIIKTLIKGEYKGMCYELCGQGHSVMLIIGLVLGGIKASYAYLN